MIKFYVDTQLLQNGISTVLPLINKNMKIAELRQIYFEINKDTLTLIATDLTHYLYKTVDIENYADNGVFAIDIDNVNVIQKLKNNSMDFEVDRDITIHSGKKIITVIKGKESEVYKVPVEKYDLLLEMQASEFIQTIKNLTPLVGTEEYRPLLTGININAKSGYITALDGHRILRKEIPLSCFNTEGIEDITISGQTYAHLKKVLNTKTQGNIQVLCGKTMYKIVNSDFTYYAKILYGDYMRTEMFFKEDASTDYMIKIKTSELKEVLEFYNSNKKKGSAEFKIYLVGDLQKEAIYTGYYNDKICLMDKISFNIDNYKGDKNTPFERVLSGIFLLDVVKLYSEEGYDVINVSISNTSHKKCVCLYAGDYQYYLLGCNIIHNHKPVREDLNMINKLRKELSLDEEEGIA